MNAMANRTCVCGPDDVCVCVRCVCVCVCVCESLLVSVCGGLFVSVSLSMCLRVYKQVVQAASKMTTGWLRFVGFLKL